MGMGLKMFLIWGVKAGAFWESLHSAARPNQNTSYLLLQPSQLHYFTCSRSFPLKGK